MNFCLDKASHELKKDLVYHCEALIKYGSLLFFCNYLNGQEEFTAWGQNREAHVVLFFMGYRRVF